MDRRQAAKILERELEKFRVENFPSLRKLIKEPLHYTLTEKAITYQIEIQSFWDKEEGGALRVMGSIDDGGFWSGFFPVSRDFLISHDGFSESENPYA